MSTGIHFILSSRLIRLLRSSVQSSPFEQGESGPGLSTEVNR